jgi:hypothetical protein
MQVVLLRNRDRLSLLWPPVFDHLCAIIRGKGVEGTLVAAAAVGLLRLCQRLLPCKPEAAEPLLRGLQLVPSLDPEVGLRVFRVLGFGTALLWFWVSTAWCAMICHLIACCVAVEHTSAHDHRLASGAGLFLSCRLGLSSGLCCCCCCYCCCCCCRWLG